MHCYYEGYIVDIPFCGYTSKGIFSILIIKMDTVEMDPALAQKLLEEGANLIFLDVPPGTEFGIDMKTWNTGDKFRGVKMIPPGVHIVHYSSIGKSGEVAPKVSFFHKFKKQEIFIKKWDVDAEDISVEGVKDEEIQRFKENLQNLDEYLGVYPYDVYSHWRKLSSHITESLLRRLTPDCGLIRSALELVSGPPKSSKRRSRSKTAEEKEEDLLPNLVPKDGCSIRFSELPEAYPEGATPQEITRHSMDTTYELESLISLVDNEMELLGELQFAFVSFLVGQSLEAMEQWTSLIKCLCNVKESLARRKELYSSFLKVLETQLTFVPEDFLVDIVSSNNLIYMSLRELFRSILEDDTGVEARLKRDCYQLKESLTQKFCWDFEDLDEEFGEDAPVVVML